MRQAFVVQRLLFFGIWTDYLLVGPFATIPIEMSTVQMQTDHRRCHCRFGLRNIVRCARHKNRNWHESKYWFQHSRIEFRITYLVLGVSVWCVVARVRPPVHDNSLIEAEISEKYVFSSIRIGREAVQENWNKTHDDGCPACPLEAHKRLFEWMEFVVESRQKTKRSAWKWISFWKKY